MLAPRLILVLGDQLSPHLSALEKADRQRDIVVMAEVAAETTYVRHHPKKIALVLAGMRRFAEELKARGWRVLYTRLDDPDSTGTIAGELLRRVAETDAVGVVATEPGEWRLIEALQDLPVRTHILQDDRFIASHAEFEDWARGRKTLRMEYFYRQLRRKTGLLMEGDAPAGGKWNFDHDNRKRAPRGTAPKTPPAFAPDDTVNDVLALVETRFGRHFGALHPFWFATSRAQAVQALDWFISHHLARFGDYQDAMVDGQRFLYHSVLSAYLNIGLLDPLETCRAADRAWRDGHVPINAAEGFIRQILGWREYVRGIYFLKGPNYVAENALGHDRDLPPFYWGAPTDMACMAAAIGQTRDEAYAHHIQRLMVTGNFALLAGVDPAQVHQWYLSVYADAFEWVEAPNTIGMSQFADGGMVASKPYVSSGAYINRMSDHCSACAYDVRARTGASACPFNLLYWHFLVRHRHRFQTNPRMGNIYRTWDRMAEDHKETVLAQADALLARLDRGAVV